MELFVKAQGTASPIEINPDDAIIRPGPTITYVPKEAFNVLEEHYSQLAKKYGATEEAKSQLLDAVLYAYRKHVLNDESIGWDELSAKLLDTLCNVMGIDKYLEWLEQQKEG